LPALGAFVGVGNLAAVLAAREHGATADAGHFGIFPRLFAAGVTILEHSIHLPFRMTFSFSFDF
jgi:hypothetical protein